MSGLRNKLLAVYDRLPVVKCKGLCQASCGPIMCTAGEAHLMQRASGRPLTFDVDTAKCGYLVEGKCSVYRVRPFVCRAWGAIARMPCIFGCVPDGTITRAEEHALFHAVKVIGGDDIVASEPNDPVKYAAILEQMQADTQSVPSTESK